MTDPTLPVDDAPVNTDNRPLPDDGPQDVTQDPDADLSGDVA